METGLSGAIGASGVEAVTGADVPLGRDEFLRLLVSKLENQDPLEPAKDTEFISQLATFSSLEQLINMSEQLEAMNVGQSQLLDTQTLNMIGKEALVPARDQLNLADGVADRLLYQIPRTAAEASLLIYGDDGEVIREIELETEPGGRVELQWNGLDDDGRQVRDGSYHIEVAAIDPTGQQMIIPFNQVMRIDGVSFFDGLITLMSNGTEIPADLILEIREGR